MRRHLVTLLQLEHSELNVNSDPKLNDARLERLLVISLKHERARHLIELYLRALAVDVALRCGYEVGWLAFESQLLEALVFRLGHCDV